MAVKYLPICLLIILPHINIASRTNRATLVESNLSFRYELEQVASEFQGKLRKELSALEMEMYNEFLQFVKEIDGNQRNLTSDLTDRLSKKVSEVMEKFNKVVAYSTTRSELLNEKMKALMVSLGKWVEKDSNSSKLNIHRNDLQGEEAAHRHIDISERNKRHTNHLKTAATTKVGDMPLPLLDVAKAKEMLTLDPEDFLLSEDNIKDIDAFLDSSSYFDGHLENHESDFTIRNYAPGTISRYVLSKEKPKGEELKYHPRKVILPRNCYDLLQEGYTQNGVYVIYPTGKDAGIEVWCEQDVAGGGWTVIIGRRAGHPFLNFTRTPTQYAHGFGIPSSNHWIGLQVMHELTQGISHTLEVRLQDQDGIHAHATYHNFRVGSSDEEYSLEVGGYDNSTSTAGDALSPHSGRPFSYPLPASGEACSHDLAVGWWYLEGGPLCYHALPTGHFHSDSHPQDNGVEWRPWRGIGYSLQSMVLMVRPSTA